MNKPPDGVKGINRKVPFSLSLSIENELTFSLTFTYLGLILTNNSTNQIRYEMSWYELWYEKN